jgi:hypothetical protein
MAPAKAWIVFEESGEYSDHRFTVRCVATTEATARACVREFARRRADEEAKTGSDMIARETRAGDVRHAEGWWCVVSPDEDDEPMRAGSYASTFGSEEADLVTPTKADDRDGVR